MAGWDEIAGDDRADAKQESAVIDVHWGVGEPLPEPSIEIVAEVAIGPACVTEDVQYCDLLMDGVLKPLSPGE